MYRGHKISITVLGLSLVATLGGCTYEEMNAGMADFITALGPESVVEESIPSATDGGQPTGIRLNTDYTGWWVDDANTSGTVMSAGGISQLEIMSVSESQIVFNISFISGGEPHFQVASDGLVTGQVRGNIASFEFNDDRGHFNKGSITFSNEALIVHVEEIGVYDDSKIMPGLTLTMDRTMYKDAYHSARDYAVSEATIGDYVFPTSDTEYLTAADIAPLTPAQMRIGRNEIYARHGVVFGAQDLNDYFATKSWYVPDYNSTFNDSQFSEVEAVNVSFIVGWENKWSLMSNGTSFVGVSGLYTSQTNPDAPQVHIAFGYGNDVYVDINAADGTNIFYGLSGTITNDTKVTVPVEDTSLVLDWRGPGYITATLSSETSSDILNQLASSGVLTNAEYALS